jgi:serine/threonine-protein kinase RsbT
MNDTCDDYVFDISEPSDTARVVYGAKKLLAKMGFDQNRQFLIASAISELATNIIRYAIRGTIALEDRGEGENRALMVTAMDRGPGIPDVPKALKEHYSTGKGLGLGLSSVKRIMDEFDICSTPGKGTRITAKKWVTRP